jgi:hypothetical protein
MEIGINKGKVKNELKKNVFFPDCGGFPIFVKNGTDYHLILNNITNCISCV